MLYLELGGNITDPIALRFGLRAVETVFSVLKIYESQGLLWVVGQLEILCFMLNLAVIVPEYDCGGPEQVALLGDLVDLDRSAQTTLAEMELPVG